MRAALFLAMALLLIGAGIGLTWLALDIGTDAPRGGAVAIAPPSQPSTAPETPPHTEIPDSRRGDREEAPSQASAFPDDAQDGAGAAPASAGADRRPAPVAPVVGEIVAPAVRDVTPDDMTPGPHVDGPLTRVAGRPVPPPPPPKKTLFHRVIIMDAGTIRVGEATILIAGIEAPDIIRLCTDSAGKPWPCGRAARSALRRLVRSRAIACRAPRLRAGVRAKLSCSVGNTDLADWLVRQGWATAAETAGEPLRQAQAEAREARRGLWR